MLANVDRKKYILKSKLLFSQFINFHYYLTCFKFCCEVSQEVLEIDQKANEAQRRRLVEQFLKEARYNLEHIFDGKQEPSIVKVFYFIYSN